MKAVINKILYGFGILCIMLSFMLLAGWGDLVPENVSTENNLLLSFVFGVSGVALIYFNPLTLKEFCEGIDKDI